MSAVTLAAAALVCVVFAAAVAGKVLSGGADALVEAIQAIRPTLTTRRARLLARAVLLAEALVVAGVLAPPTRVAAFGVAALLLLVFAGVAWRSSRLVQDVTCRCFGTDGHVLGVRHVVRNLTLVLVCVAGVLARHATRVGVDEGLVVCATAALAGYVVVRADDVLDGLAFLRAGGAA